MRIAMLGAGYIAGVNGTALLSLPEVELCAISNHHPEKARRLADTLGTDCPVYADWREMLDKEKPDAAAIFLPHYLHERSFLDCAARGINVIIEKALANTYEECLRMIDAAEKSGIRATVCHTQRYNAVYMAAKAYAARHEAELGRLLSVNDNIHIHYFWDGRSPWQLSTAQSGGGIALNYGVHQLDRVHWFLQQRTVDFHARYLCEKPGYEVCSSYAMLGVGDGGTPYAITCTGYSGPYINETRLVYENGVLQCNLTDSGCMPYGLYGGSTESGRLDPLLVPHTNELMYERQFIAAVDYLAGRTDTPPVPLSWAAEMVRLVELGFAQNGGHA